MTISFLRTIVVVFLVFASNIASGSDYADKLKMGGSEYNSNIQGIVTGSVTGTYIKIGNDLGRLMAQETDLRVMTYVGEGSLTNILDLLLRRGVDLAIVQSDVLAHLEFEYPNNEEIAKLAYISKIYNEEIHLVGRADAPSKSLMDLKGKRVNIGVSGSGTQMTSNNILEYLNLHVVKSELPNDLALQALKNGEIDAMIMVAGRPTSLLSNVKSEDGLRLFEIPFLPELADTYSRAEFRSTDYPGLVTDKFVPTISVGAILTVYDSFADKEERYLNAVKFTETFFKNIDVLQNGKFHEKWKEIEISADVPGWKRYSAAQAFIDKLAKTNN